MDSRSSSPDETKGARLRRRKLTGRTSAVRKRGRLVEQNPFCQRCQADVVDVRLLKKRPGVVILTQRIRASIAWLDEEGLYHEFLIATVHHKESLAKHRRSGKGNPHRDGNLEVYCVYCHREIEQEQLVARPNKPR